MNTSGSSRTHKFGLLTIVLFAGLSIASGKPKGDASKKAADEKKTAAAVPSGDPSKGATLLGSCDRSTKFYKDCTETYLPLTTLKKPADEKKSCESMGGQFILGHCPRINAVSQCFQGSAPYLSGSYYYEGAKSKVDPESCLRGYKDLKKTPELTESSQPASCNAIATAGTCTQYEKLTAATERSCLVDGGTIKQPPEPCPTENGLAAYKFKLPEPMTEYFYTSTYTGFDGASDRWKTEDLVAICGLAEGCTKVPFPTAAPSAAPSAAPVKVSTKPRAKK